MNSGRRLRARKLWNSPRRWRLPGIRLFWHVAFSFAVVSVLAVTLSAGFNIQLQRSLFIRMLTVQIQNTLGVLQEQWREQKNQSEDEFSNLTRSFTLLEVPVSAHSSLPLTVNYSVIVRSSGAILEDSQTSHVRYEIEKTNLELMRQSGAGYAVRFTPLYGEYSLLVWTTQAQTGYLWAAVVPFSQVQHSLYQSILVRSILAEFSIFLALALGAALITRVFNQILRKLVLATEGKLSPEILATIPVLEVQRMGAALQENYRRLREISVRDSLTGLYNRRALERFMEDYFAQPTPVPAVGILFDLDRFKQLNDSQGHQAGDQALQAVANYLFGLADKGILAARLGGDEFVVVAFGTTVTDSFLEQLRQHSLALSERPPKGLSASLGIAALPLEASSFGEFYRLADQRMYQAKDAGGGCVISAQGRFCLSAVAPESESDPDPDPGD
ncbi:GGDEF domain-containing protein [Alicyclobacillaceae bacterium I2511]|nr:GGDEF domain-containing protein [Alicyclobacillaceae bacterium I2511]